MTNIHKGVFSGETRTITKPSIAAIGPNKQHPYTSGVSPTGPFTNGKVPTKSQN